MHKFPVILGLAAIIYDFIAFNRQTEGIELLTRRTGDGGTALVLRLLHHAVLAYGFDEGADPENEC